MPGSSLIKLGLSFYKIAVSLKRSLTLFVYIDQFVISSESMAPRSPNSAPEAPTEILFCMNKEDSTLPPNPDSR